MNKKCLHYRLWALCAAMIAVSAGILAPVQLVVAGELDKLDTSLKLIPADAAFYSSMLRNREQIEAFLNSNAWAKIRSMPSMQMALGLYNSQAQQSGSPVSRFQAARENPEIKKIINLAADMGSNEIFMYGEEDFNGFVELMQYIFAKMRYGPAVLQATGEARGLSSDKMQQKLVLEALIEHMDLVKVPNVLVGFRLKKPSAATEALIKLETICNLALEAAPSLKGHLNRETVGEVEYLVLRLDGKMIPWKKVPLNDMKQLVESEADLQKLVEHVKNMELVIAMGVRENDLLVSVGSSLDCIKNLGAGTRLADRPEFKPLEKFADKRLTHVGYISKELNERINNNAQNIDDLQEFLVKMIPLAGFSEAESNDLTKSIEGLADDIKAALPVLGSIMRFQFMTDNGYEGYTYAWGKTQDLDGSKPLGLLNHMGGSPILAVVARGKASPEGYDKMIKWMKVGRKCFEQFALPRMPEEERSKALALIKDLDPLLERLNKTVRDMLLPALADGQVGLVLDDKFRTKQLQQSLPELTDELPVIEPALVFGVSNADLLSKAMTELRAIYNDLVDVIGRQKDLPSEVAQNINNFKWPEAQTAKIEGGSIYTYQLPADWGVDKNVIPNAGLSDRVAVIALSPKQTGRLLKETAPKVGGLLADVNRPLAAAGWIDWTELLNGATPWINYTLQQMTDQQLGGQKESVIAQVHTVLEVLSTIKSLTSECYVVDDAVVKHTLLEIHDLAK
jgi:hypothetical protein